MGITPAHAGKTAKGKVATLACGDHPRACGENAVEQQNESDSAGSPPRMRGKLHAAHTAGEPGGITPAHAGKTVLNREVF